MNPSPETNQRTAANPDRAPSAAGMVVVHIPGPLRALTGGAGEVEVRGGTVAEVLERLVTHHPGLRRHLLTDSGAGTEVRDYVNIFVNEEDVRTLDGVATAVGSEDAITIVPSIAGG
jgi:molybdopterin converting factor small subunit